MSPALTRRPHRSPRRALGMLVLGLAVLGCGAQAVARPAEDGRDGPAIVTDAEMYIALPTEKVWDFYRHAFRLVARTTNRTNAPLYLQTCRPGSTVPMYGVVFADTLPGQSPGRRQPAYALAWACVGHDRPLELLPGAMRVDTLQLQGPTRWDGRTHEPFGDVEGAFRLGYQVSRCRADGPCAMGDTVWYSNVFQVRRGSP